MSPRVKAAALVPPPRYANSLRAMTDSDPVLSADALTLYFARPLSGYETMTHGADRMPTLHLAV